MAARTGVYDDWAAYLEVWGRGGPADDAVLRPVDMAVLPADGRSRLMNRLTGAVSLRLESWAKALERAMADAGDEFGVGRALTQGRSGLRSIRALAGHPFLPEAVREQLCGVVDGQAEAVQRHLEEGVDDLRRRGLPPRAVEARLRTLRENRLTAVAAEGAPSTGPDQSWAVLPAPGRRGASCPADPAGRPGDPEAPDGSGDTRRTRRH